MNLKLRAALAPLTRIRAEPKTRVPSDVAVEYYKQRAADGVLQITEATLISPETISAHTVPGIWTGDQVKGWQKVTDAVHSKGGYIYCQLWHQGRVAHGSFTQDEQVKGTGYTVCRSASDVAIDDTCYMTYDNVPAPYTKPTALALDEIDRLREDFIKAVRLSLPL
jgi:2,4-dienoyl-CoA reductase-like NADH-dependent reductase (Old Yellow Enzyme family)